MLKKLLVLSPLVYLFNGSVTAQTTFDTGANNYALPVEELAHSPWFTTIITKEIIANLGVTSITEALGLIPGMMALNPVGNYNIASYRGMADEYPRNYKVYLNDVPYNLASNGSVLWDALPIKIDDIEKIVFIANPSSSINQSHTVNGALRLYTTSPMTAMNAVSYVSDQRGEQEAYVRGATSLSDNLSVMANFSVKDGKGVQVEPASNTIKRANLSLEYTPNLLNTLSFNLGANRSLLDFNSSKRQPQIPSYENRTIENVVSNLSWVNTRYGHTSAVVGVNWLNHDAVNELSQVPNPIPAYAAVIPMLTPVFDISYKSSRYFGSVKHRNAITDTLGFSLGAEWMKDVETPNYFSQSAHRWVSEQKNANFSLDYASQSGNLASAGAGYLTHNLFPGAVKDFHLSMGKIVGAHSLNLLWSEGMRFPTNWEAMSEHYIYIAEMPQVTLQRDKSLVENVSPEKVSSVSLSYEFIDSGFLNKLKARLFRDQFTNASYTQYIPVPTGTGLYGKLGVPYSAVITNGNGDEFSVTGLELHVKKSLSSQFSMFTSYGRYRLWQPTTNVMNRDNTVPKEVFSNVLSHKLNGFVTNLNYNYNSAVKWYAGSKDDPEKRRKAWENLALTSRYCHQTAQLNELCVNVGAYNLLNNRSNFFTFDDQTGMARLYRLGISAQF